MSKCVVWYVECVHQRHVLGTLHVIPWCPFFLVFWCSFVEIIELQGHLDNLSAEPGIFWMQSRLLL